MMNRRVFKVNSLLKEVISEVLRKDLHHVVSGVEFLSITSVEITPDLSYAKVYFSFIGEEKAKAATCAILNKVAGLIARMSSRKVRLRLFPKLHFYIDEGLEKQLRICEILEKIAPHPEKEGPAP